LAFLAEEAAGCGDDVIALLEDVVAGAQGGSPLVDIRAELAAMSSWETP
jgi:hypothetical protein